MPRASKQALRRALTLERQLLVLASEAQSHSNKLANLASKVHDAEVDAAITQLLADSTILIENEEQEVTAT